MSFVCRLAAVLAGSVVALSCAAAQAPLDNPELATMIERVIATHPSADAARAKVAAARSELSGSRWARFPGISVESFADRRDGGSLSAAVAVEQPLWSGGRISASIRESQGQLEAALASLDEIYLDLALRTVQAYVDVQSLRRRAQILDDSLVQHRKLVDSMQRRVQQQISPASELQLAQSRMRQTESEALQTRASAQIALLRLRELVGQERLEVQAALNYRDEPQAPDVTELLGGAMRFDPQRRRIAAEAAIASAEVSMRKSELLPQIGARYVHQLGDDRDEEDQLGLVIRFQTDGGLSRISAIGAARQRERAATLAVDAARREQRELVTSEFTAYSSAQLRVLAGRDAALAAQAVTDSFLRQFAAGRRTWPEVLNAVREAVTAKLAQVEAEGSAVSTYLRLMLICGRWQPGAAKSAP